MTKAEALEQLSSSSQRERLAAARVMSRLATRDDVAALRAAIRNETVPWIRTALDVAIAHAVAAPSAEPSADEGEPPPLSDETLSNLLASGRGSD